MKVYFAIKSLGFNSSIVILVIFNYCLATIGHSAPWGRRTRHRWTNMWT